MFKTKKHVHAAASAPTPLLPDPAVAAADMPAWLVAVMRDSALCRDLYATAYQSAYAWCESNETEGPGADLDARRAAYERFTVLSDRYWSLRRKVSEAHDAFTTREIDEAATHQAHETYRGARDVLLGRAG